MSRQFQDKQFVPVNQLDPWVQDAIDLIEFANGPATSTWGKLRADMGHPEPFGLTMLAVGNEQWGEEYFERYQVFAGEFAAHERNRASTLRAALCEATGMTGMVRNADVVVMTAYAPLFAKTGTTQWTPDLIFFDNTRVMLTPSYHVQSMFARHRPDAEDCRLLLGPEFSGDFTLSLEARKTGGKEGFLVLFDDQPIHQAKRAANQPLYACAGIDKHSRDLVIQAVNLADTAVETDITIEAIRPAAAAAAELLASDSLDAVNSFDSPAKVAPAKTTVPVPGPQFKHHFPARSLTTLRIPSA